MHRCASVFDVSFVVHYTRHTWFVTVANMFLCSNKHVGSKPLPSSSVPVKIPTRGLSGPLKSSPAWGKVAQSPPVTSLKDVMNEEVMKLENPPRQSVQASENK